MTNRSSENTEALVGQRILRIEDQTLLRGRGRFVDDMPTYRNTLHAAFVRSPHPHARIEHIDIQDALKSPGVHAVITGHDVWPLTSPLLVGFKNPMDYRGIAHDKVRYVGEPVAVVCATDRYLAEDAAARVRVAYDPLPAVVDPVDATRSDAPLLHEAAGSNVISHREFSHGNTDAAFEAATHTCELDIRYPRNAVTPIEGYAVVAEYKSEDTGYDVLSNFQGPFSVHTVMAMALNIKSSKLRHRSPPNSGGSFGSKLTIFPYIVVLCVCARLTGRPVKWIEDRLEHLCASSVAPNRVTHIEAAYRADGTVQALRLKHWDDHGAYLRAPMPAPIYRMHGLSTNGYAIQNVDVINQIIVTNKCPTGAVRGFGGPQLYFAIERMMHKIATLLQLDPLKVMQRNLIQPQDFPYRTPAGSLLDSGNYQKVIEDATQQGDIADLLQRRAERRAQGKIYGIGYASAVEPSQSNMGYISTLKTHEERERAGPKDGAVASCTVSVDALGSVSVIGDSTPQGQGHQTALTQIVADELGISMDDIAVNLETDTQKDNWSIAAGNYSCRFAPASASAAKEAAVKVRQKMTRIASSQMNVPAADLEFKDGWIQSQSNPDNRLEFRRIGGLAHWSPSSLPDDMEPAMRETAHWSGPELTPTTANDEINTSLAYGFGFDFCGIEIDPDTGRVTIDKYVTAHDCGTIINPGLAEGQIRGSFASAIGATLYEEFVYSGDGSFLSGTFADYLIATPTEAVDPVLVHTEQTPSPYTRLGAKGIGEGNQYTTPVCIANAVADALGRESIELPLVPSKVFEWIHAEEETPPPKQTAQPVKWDDSGTISSGGVLDIDANANAIWSALVDPDRLARVFPGCRSLLVTSDNVYQGVVDLGVGPVSGTFDAFVELSDLDPPHTMTLTGKVTGPLGTSRGVGIIKMIDTGQSTKIEYSYQIGLSGTVASVGGRLISGATRVLISRFFAALVVELNADISGDPKKRSWFSKLRSRRTRNP